MLARQHSFDTYNCYRACFANLNNSGNRDFLANFVGILLALPVAAVLAVLVRHAHQRYRTSRWYSQPEDGPDKG